MEKHVWELEYCSNMAKMTPIHVAATWPYGLQLILEWATDDIDIDQRDARGCTPLNIALALSEVGCCEGSHDMLCNNCECSRSTELLLQFGARIAKRSSPSSCLVGSLRTKQLILEHLKSRCLELQGVATRLLSIPIGVAGDQLQDVRIPEIIGLLKESGITLRPTLERQFRNWGSIYAWIYDTATASYAYKLGFRDINGYDYYGRLPIARVQASVNIPYVNWLLEHGARLDVPYLENRSDSRLSACHVALYQLAGSWPLYGHVVQPLLGSGAPMQLSDGCGCKCTTNGCYPLTYLLMAIIGNYEPIPVLLELFDILTSCGVDLISESWILPHCIRAVTFREMQMKHTCCQQNPFHRRRIGYEEEEEDAELGSIFVSLMENIEMAYEEKGTLRDFLEGTYRDIMTATLERRNSRVLTIDERKEAEEIGVIWETDAEDEFDHSNSESMLETKDPQHWLMKMDEIMPELPGWSPPNTVGVANYGRSP